MMTYTQLQHNRRKFLALTGLTVAEFERLLPAFSRAYQRLYPTDQTVEGQRRRRNAGSGRKGVLHRPEEKLLFILVYLKTYPLQVVIGELFALSQPQANHWIQRLLPVLQVALEDLGVRPERNPLSLCPKSTGCRTGASAHHRRHGTASPEAEKP